MGQIPLKEEAAPAPRGRILLVANPAPEAGSSRLRRALELLRDFDGRAALYAPDNEILNAAAKLGFAVPEDWIAREPQKEGPWRLAVLDNRRTAAEQTRFFLNLAPAVALNEEGEGRKIAPYLIDLLPALPEAGAPNEHCSGYLRLPERVSGQTRPPRKILIAFGGSDRERLTETAGQLLDSFQLPADSWSVVKGPLFKRTFAWPGVKILHAPDIKEILSGYDLVITKFGITAYEAAAAGSLPLLLNPNTRSERLAKAAGFPVLGVKEPKAAMAKRLEAFLLGREGAEFELNVALQSSKNLAAKLEELAGQTGGCPACPESPSRFGPVVYRDIKKSYAQCPHCGLVYQEAFYKEEPKKGLLLNGLTKNQSLKAFEEERKLAFLRLKRIAQNLKTGGKTLLEIGCGHGAFLQAAGERGFEAFGIEEAGEAALYAKERLGLQAESSSFPCPALFEGRQFDGAVLWNVLERLPETDLAMRKISALIKPEGLLAFSAAKGDGLSAKNAPTRFYSSNNTRVIFSKKNIKRFLKKYGFKPVKIRTGSIYPERKWPKLKKGGLRYKWHRLLCLLSGMGDSFEIYAKKLKK